jgi:hypothetical protein
MSTAPKLAPHPMRSVARNLAILGGLGVVAGGVFLLTARDFQVQNVLIPAGGAWLLVYGMGLFRQINAVQLGNAALDRLTRGHFDEAEAILDSIPPRDRRRQIGRAIGVQRTMLALYRDDPRRAIQEASRAIDGRLGLITREHEEVQILAARGLRAIAAASVDDAETADADVRAVRASPGAQPETLARVALAEVIKLSRAKDREQLEATLKKERRLLLEFTTPRDRALVRALQRTVYTRGASAYRERARPEEPPRENPLGDWIAGVAPAAAGLAPRAKSATAEVVPVAPAAPGAPEVQRGPAPRGFLRPLILWGVLIACFVGVWTFLTPSHPRPVHEVPVVPSEPDATFPSWLMVGIFAVVGCAAMGAVLLTNRRSARQVAAAMRLLALPDPTEATRAFEKLSKNGRLPVVAAQADLQLARIATRQARFEDALVCCDRGLQRVRGNAYAAQLITPALVSERALALAALGRGDESLAEQRLMTSQFGGYPYLASAQLRSSVMLAVRRGDLATARRLAAQRTPDQPLSYEDETLADALVATADGANEADDVERICGELRDDPELLHWLQAVWPEGEGALNRAAGAFAWRRAPHHE